MRADIAQKRGVAVLLFFVTYLLSTMKSRRSWSDKQDEAFGRLARESEPKNWSAIAKRLASECGFKRRSGKQCRQRWYNHLVPGISKKVWSKAEEERLMALHRRFGNKWTLIAEQMPGRTDNSIKNYFYSTVRRSLRRMGKLIGSRNSTSLMRAIKPSTLTQIFSVLSEDPLPPFHQHLHEEFESLEALRQSCEHVRDEIVQFSSFKPKKSDEVEEAERSRYERVFQVILKLNSVYERYRGVQRNAKSEEELFKEGFRQMMKEESSEEPPLSEIGEDSREEAEAEAYPEFIRNRSTRTRRIKVPEKLSCLANFESNHTQPQIVVKAPKQQPSQEKAEQLELVAHSPSYSPSLVELEEPIFQIDLKQDINFTLGLPLTSPNFYFGTPADRVNFFKSPLAASRLPHNNFSFFNNSEERE